MAQGREEEMGANRVLTLASFMEWGGTRLPVICRVTLTENTVQLASLSKQVKIELSKGLICSQCLLMSYRHNQCAETWTLVNNSFYNCLNLPRTSFKSDHQGACPVACEWLRDHYPSCFKSCLCNVQILLFATFLNPLSFHGFKFKSLSSWRHPGLAFDVASVY